MKGTRFLSMRAALAVCILALALVAEAGFISVALAGKPTTTSYGCATLTDTDSYVIQSDRGVQYLDKNKGGEDMVEITTDTTGALVSSKTILGIVEYQSTRRVRFLFDIANYTQRLVVGPKAVLDILTTLGTHNGTVHFRVLYYASPSVVDDVAFIIDPGYAGKDPLAITQTAVNNFYTTDKDENYRTSDYGHVIYYLDYPSGISPVGSSPPWTFEPSGSPVVLYVMRTKGKGNVYERLNLAKYGEIPFKLTVNLVQAAPRKHNTLSTTWGEVK